ncbi:putative nuclease [Pelagibacter phage HTVC204P]|nr:putative nuclease [Pelagibacter phage HTVC204P]
MNNEKIQKAFSIFNGGEGLDHWSYSSTSTPLAKNLIGYTFPQEVRRTFAFRYKANFGNLVNNVVQRMIADVIYKSKTIKQDKFTEEERSYQNCFNKELEIMNEKQPVDAKDKFGREAMIKFAEDCIPITKKVVQDIIGKEKLVCERYVEQKEMTMIKPVIGRIDYESKTKFIELKTKPPNLRKVKGKEEWNMITQDLPTEPTIENLTQTSFYYMATKKIPYLVYVNDKDYVIFDQSHELMKADHLEFLYFKMVEKILLWERMIMFAEGKVETLAMMCEPPDLNHFFYYKDLADEQKQLITKLWGIKYE